MGAAHFIAVFGVIRIVIGVAPFVAAGPSMRLLGFPGDHDNPTGRLMGRLFGVRDIGLGVLALLALDFPAWLGFVCLFNAAHDLGDVFSFAIPLLRRDGIDRGALTGMAIAGPAIGAWLIAWSML